MKPNHNINEEPNPCFFTLAEVHQLREIIKDNIYNEESLIKHEMFSINLHREMGETAGYPCTKQDIKDCFKAINKSKQKIKNYAKLQTKLKHTLVTAG